VHFQLVEKEVKDVELFRGDVVKSDRRVGAALKINFYKLHEFTYKLHYIKNPGKSICIRYTNKSWTQSYDRELPRQCCKKLQPN
jgi:hypothetical protein